MSEGVVRFGYSEQVPPRAVAIAEITCTDVRPAQIVDIEHLPLTSTAQGPQPYTVWADSLSSNLTFTASGLGGTIPLAGHTTYYVKNQFWELTDTIDPNGVPLYYRHPLPSSTLTSFRLLTLAGEEVAPPTLVRSGYLYHAATGDALWLEYFADGAVQRDLLQYTPALTQVAGLPAAGQVRYSSGGKLEVATTGSYWLRLTAETGYQVLPPYNVPLNDPWYLRVRFSPIPAIAKEWPRQPFVPGVPYLQATWVPGTVLSPEVIELERPHAYFDGKTFPDILVYDAHYRLKYALDGSPENSPQTKGYLFPWIRSQFRSFDAARARAHVGVALEATDRCFGFYYYNEPDILYTALDINPYSNPTLKDKIVQFYYADRSSGAPAIPPNGGFEEGVLNPWLLSIPGSGTVTLAAGGRSGNFCIQMGPNNNQEMAYQDLYGFTPGTTYLFSAWVRGSTDHVPVLLACHDTLGGNPTTASFTIGTNWTLVSMTYTVNQTTAMRIHLLEEVCPYYTFWDDVSITPA